MRVGTTGSGMLVACAYLAQRAKRLRIAAPEVIVPANVRPGTVGCLDALGLVPVFVDILPGLYVLRAQDVAGALVEKTAGVIAPFTFGNVPEVDDIRRAAAVHDAALVLDVSRTGRFVESPGAIVVSDTHTTLLDDDWQTVAGGDDEGMGLDVAAALGDFYDLAPVDENRPTHRERFNWLYERLGFLADRLTLPRQIDEPGDIAPRWNAFPILCDTPVVQHRVLTDVGGFVHQMRNVVDHPAMATIGPWMKKGDLPGATVMAERGVALALPTAEADADRIAETMRQILG